MTNILIVYWRMYDILLIYQKLHWEYLANIFLISISNIFVVYCPYFLFFREQTLNKYIETERDDRRCDLPLLLSALAIAFGAIVLLLSGLAFLKLIKRCIARRRSSREPGKTADNVQVKRRVRSLDTVRG